VVLIRLRRTEAQWSANIRGGLSGGLKYSRTYANAPFSIRGTLAEHFNLKRSEAKSRWQAGRLNLI
jgi:hypothetical protein